MGKKMTRKEKIELHRELKKRGYPQGEQVIKLNGVEITVKVVGKELYLATGRKLPVPEEWWV